MTRPHVIAIALTVAMLAGSCDSHEGTATVYGDGSTLGARVFMDGTEVGAMKAASGEMSRFPASAVHHARRVGLPDTAWVAPGPGFARCDFPARYGPHVVRVVALDGRSLEVKARVNRGAEIRVSFRVMATQAFELD